MSTIIAGRFDEEAKASRARAVLADSGFPAHTIAMFFVTPAGQHDWHGTPADPEASAGAHHAGAGAAIGAAAGTGVGAVVGLATIPFLGPAGPIAGAAIGAYVGSLAGAVNQLEAPEVATGGPGNPDQIIPEKPPRKSGYLVAVVADDTGDQTRALSVLRGAGAIDVEQAKGMISGSEWDDFDPIASPKFVRTPSIT